MKRLYRASLSTMSLESLCTIGDYIGQKPRLWLTKAIAVRHEDLCSNGSELKHI